MTAKEQKIKEAYGEHWDRVKQDVDENGWLYHPKGGEVTFIPFIGFMDEHPIDDAYRPKSLSGIEFKTLHANKDYVLHNGQVFILGELAEAPKHINNYVITFEGCMKYDWSMHFGGFDRNSRIIIASTYKSLPVKHIDRNLFVKPVDVGQIFDNNFDCYADTWQGDAESMHAGDVIPAMTKDKFVEVFNKNANPNQFTLEEMKKAISKSIAMASNEQVFHSDVEIHKAILEELRPLSLSETIQCDDNYENLKPIWK